MAEGALAVRERGLADRLRPGAPVEPAPPPAALAACAAVSAAVIAAVLVSRDVTA
jgi:hypothetical protein